MYGNEFGIGKAVAVLSGYANKFDGNVTAYPGCEGGGSMDLEVSLPPHAMSALESYQDFMEAVSVPNPLHYRISSCVEQLIVLNIRRANLDFSGEFQNHSLSESCKTQLLLGS
ncbi:hypothetical protein CR513_27650, partial [Mucuna pruriens]